MIFFFSFMRVTTARYADPIFPIPLDFQGQVRLFKRPLNRRTECSRRENIQPVIFQFLPSISNRRNPPNSLAHLGLCKQDRGMEMPEPSSAYLLDPFFTPHPGSGQTQFRTWSSRPVCNHPVRWMTKQLRRFRFPVYTALTCTLPPPLPDWGGRIGCGRGGGT